VGGTLQRRDRADDKCGGALRLRHPVCPHLRRGVASEVPSGYFQSTLKHSVGLSEYLTLAWLGTSLATVAGALGASLEDEETVRKASYGYRQRRRHEDDNGHEDESEGDPAKH
jgi:hypothetical protein